MDCKFNPFAVNSKIFSHIKCAAESKSKRVSHAYTIIIRLIALLSIEVCQASDNFHVQQGVLLSIK